MKIKLALAALLLVGSSCGPVSEKDPTNPVCDAKCQSESTTLKASFVSGHLGNYNDCPEDGYTPDNQTEPDGTSSDGLSADCDSLDGCGILNCEKASAILQLSVGGNNDALGILVQKIELKNTDGDTVAILPLESVTRVDNNQQFSGKVGVDETTAIRIDFQGPVNPYQLLQAAGASDERVGGAPANSGGGVLHITLTADNAADVIVISPVTSSIPSVDT